MQPLLNNTFYVLPHSIHASITESVQYLSRNNQEHIRRVNRLAHLLNSLKENNNHSYKILVSEPTAESFSRRESDIKPHLRIQTKNSLISTQEPQLTINSDDDEEQDFCRLEDWIIEDESPVINIKNIRKGSGTQIRANNYFEAFKWTAFDLRPSYLNEKADQWLKKMDLYWIRALAKGLDSETRATLTPKRVRALYKDYLQMLLLSVNKTYNLVKKYRYLDSVIEIILRSLLLEESRGAEEDDYRQRLWDLSQMPPEAKTKEKLNKIFEINICWESSETILLYGEDDKDASIDVCSDGTFEIKFIE